MQVGRPAFASLHTVPLVFLQADTPRGRGVLWEDGLYEADLEQF